jgi:hypothetical protein
MILHSSDHGMIRHISDRWIWHSSDHSMMWHSSIHSMIWHSYEHGMIWHISDHGIWHRSDRGMIRHISDRWIWHSSDHRMMWHSSDSRSDLTSVCSRSVRLDRPVQKTVNRHVLALSTRDTNVPPRCAGGLCSSDMVVGRRRFETTCRSHFEGPSSPTTNTRRVKSLKSEDPSLMEIFSFMLTCVGVFDSSCIVHVKLFPKNH